MTDTTRHLRILVGNTYPPTPLAEVQRRVMDTSEPFTVDGFIAYKQLEFAGTIEQLVSVVPEELVDAEGQVLKALCRNLTVGDLVLVVYVEEVDEGVSFAVTMVPMEAAVLTGQVGHTVH